MRTQAAVIALLLLATPALAQRAAHPARDGICTAIFKDTRAQVGMRVEFDRSCAAAFPLTTEVAGWSFPDGDLLRLFDSAGHTLTEFSEVEDGIYEAPTP